MKQTSDGLLTLHISQVPVNVGLIRIVKDLANPDTEIVTDGSWSREEIRRLTREYPQLVVELQVSANEKLNFLVDQLTGVIEENLSLQRMFADVDEVKENLEERIKDVFDEKIISFTNKMTMLSYGVGRNVLAEHNASYSKLISYSTECFVSGMLFAEYLEELSVRQKNNLGKGLILHKIGYIETMEESRGLLDRTVAILENSGYDREIIQFARDQGTTRFKDGDLKNLPRATEIGKIVTHYCNCTINNPEEISPYKVIQNYEAILDSPGRRREMMFDPALLTKFVEMIRKGLEMPKM